MSNDEVKEIRLRTWEEIVGVCLSIEQGEFGVSIVIGKLKVVFPSDSPEAEALRRQIDARWIGKRVGVLKTGISSYPLVIREIARK